MKRNNFLERLIGEFLFLFLLIPQQIQAQTDTVKTNRYIMRTMMYGIGTSNIYDSYLSPQNYKGIDFRISREAMRFTKRGKGKVSSQNFLQANFSYTHNRANNNNTISGLINWNYGYHHQFPISENFKLLAGGLLDMNGGFVYNLQNTNNPASARAFINMDVSGMAIWHFKIKQYSFVLRYQLNIPVIGIMFSPQYDESYYEIFTLGNTSNIIKLTSPYNQPSLRQMLSLDAPIGHSRIRFSYLADMEQSRINNIKTHTYSHVFMVGIVRSLYLIHSKRGKPLPPSLRVY
ncbi:MAG: DUF3316 domain-containing protein [Bacteroidaceae bacterium]|nr:DUF3316 domain-containing protein [Bacteroidaceae bacterium]